MINQSEALADQDKPFISKENAMPKEKSMNKLIKDEFRFERRKYLFMNVNTINLVLTIYNLISPINIEGQKSLIYYEETRRIDDRSSLTLINLLDALIIVHLIRVFTCVLGYFSTSQKSGRIITYFMILSTVCVLCRGIISLLIMLNYQDIKSICSKIFDYEDGDDTVGSLMAFQFLFVLLFFVVIEILLALISLIQCAKTKEEYQVKQKDIDRLLKSYSLCYEVVINQLEE